MSIHFLENNYDELRFTAIGGAPHGINASKGNSSNDRFKHIIFIFLKKMLLIEIWFMRWPGCL